MRRHHLFHRYLIRIGSGAASYREVHRFGKIIGNADCGSHCSPFGHGDRGNELLDIYSFRHLDVDGMVRLVDDTDIFTIQHKRENPRLVMFDGDRKLAIHTTISDADHRRSEQIQMCSYLHRRGSSFGKGELRKSHIRFIIYLRELYYRCPVDLVNNSRIFLIQCEGQDITITVQIERVVFFATCQHQ